MIRRGVNLWSIHVFFLSTDVILAFQRNVDNLDVVVRFIVLRICLHLTNLLHHVHSFNDAAEHSVLVVKPGLLWQEETKKRINFLSVSGAKYLKRKVLKPRLSQQPIRTGERPKARENEGYHVGLDFCLASDWLGKRWGECSRPIKRSKELHWV